MSMDQILTGENPKADERLIRDVMGGEPVYQWFANTSGGLPALWRWNPSARLGEWIFRDGTSVESCLDPAGFCYENDFGPATREECERWLGWHKDEAPAPTVYVGNELKNRRVESPADALLLRRLAEVCVTEQDQYPEGWYSSPREPDADAPPDAWIAYAAAMRRQKATDTARSEAIGARQKFVRDNLAALRKASGA